MTKRLPVLDLLRGLAIILMFADHLAVVASAPDLFRLPGRLAMPLFMVVSGYLFSGFTWNRFALIASAAFAAFFAESHLGLIFPGILLIYLFCLPLLPLVARFPQLALFLALLSLSLPAPWSNYHPGYILAFLALGRLITWPVNLLRSFDFSAPSYRLFEFIGRQPLIAYVAHLLILVILTNFVTH